jgi:hypothetical protein
MKLILMTTAAILSSSAWVWGDDALPDEKPTLPTSLYDEPEFAVPMEGDSELHLPPARFLFLDPVAAAAEKETDFSLGAAVGYLHARGADRGTWMAGVQGRLHFLKFLAAEGSITFHENKYQGGDARVTQYPVQVSGMIYPIPEGQFRPYALAGVGWYYTRITYAGVLSGIQNKTEHVFGEHAGAGLEIRLGTSTSIDADVRYIFLNPSNSAIKKRDFNYWQGTAGINFFF